MELLDDLLSGKPAEKILQNDSEATKAPKFGKEDNIYLLSQDPNKSCQTLYNFYRAFNGSSSGTAKISIGGRHVFIDSCRPLLLNNLDSYELGHAGVEHLQRFSSLLPNGSLFMFDNIRTLKGQIGIKLADGWLFIYRLHLGGEKPTAAKAWYKQHISDDLLQLIGLLREGSKPLDSQLTKID